MDNSENMVPNGENVAKYGTNRENKAQAEKSWKSDKIWGWKCQEMETIVRVCVWGGGGG